MKSTLASFWETLRSSYWFIPTLMTLAAIGLSYGLLFLDSRLHLHPKGVAWLYSGGASGARSVLSTVASSVITVAGTTFSITIAALSLASSQFGPRLLRGFLRDTGNQIVLGTFIGTFVYCLLILRIIRGTDHDVLVPNLAVSGGVLLSLASVGVLIYFINHVSISIQAAHVLSSVTGELNEAIDRLYPAHIGQGERDVESPTAPEDTSSASHTVTAHKSGYVQIINEEKLMQVAIDAGGILEITCRPGTFTTEGVPLAIIRTAQVSLPEHLRKRVNAAFVLGPNQTMAQDAGFGFDQLVEVAVRALSPGINDPFTAMMCLDRIGECLTRVAARPIPSKCRYDQAQVLRILTHPQAFADFADASFGPIRRNGRDSFAVLMYLLSTIEVVSASARPEDCAVLRRQVGQIYAHRDSLPDTEDQDSLAARCAETLHALEDRPLREEGSYS